MVSMITSLLSLIFMPFLLIIQLIASVVFKLFFYIGGIYMTLAIVLLLWIEDAKVYPLTINHGIAVCAMIAAIVLFVRLYTHVKRRHYRQLNE